MYIAALYVWIGLTIGNLILEGFVNNNWDKAKERSFYQALALGTFLLLMAIK